MATQTTLQELEALCAILYPVFLDYLKSHSTAVDQIETATTLQGVSTFPVRYTLGGVTKTVLLPIDLLKEVADKAADLANQAAQNATQATQAATTATNRANRAATDAQAAAEAATQQEQQRQTAEAQRQKDFEVMRSQFSEHTSQFVSKTGDTMTGPLTATAFAIPKGAAAQFLKADGTLDNNHYTPYSAPGSNVDLNTLTNPGLYRLAATPQNAPTDAVYSYSNLMVISGGSDTLTQIICHYQTQKLWFRSGNTKNGDKDNIATRPWTQLTTTADLEKATVATATTAEQAHRFGIIADITPDNCNTIGDVKKRILEIIKTAPAGAGTCIKVQESLPLYWDNDSHPYEWGYQYTMMRIDSYQGDQYGRWILATCGDRPLREVGLVDGQWQPMRQLLTTQEVSTLEARITTLEEKL